LGRREQPLPPGPLHDFAAQLRALRAGTGLTYRELAVKAGYSYSALSAAAKGETLPSLDVTLAYVGACGGDMAEWEQRWHRLAGELRRTHPGLVADDAPTTSIPHAGPAPLTDSDPATVGRITVAARLGAGSMGQVYLGRTETGEPVALKIVRGELAADPVFRRRFRRELGALRQVESPYTAALVAADAEAERPWLASDYQPSVSLAEAVDTHGPLPSATVARLAGGIARALAAIHANGLVHRDLKPANVLLTENGLYVIDFGIAAAVEGTGLTATGAHLGTAAYMAPEQASGADIDPAADVFALGSLLVYALTGTPPFGEGQPTAVLYRIVHEQPKLGSLDTLTAGDNLRVIVEACLAKDPADRPTPAQLLEEHRLSGYVPEPGWLPDDVVTGIAGHATAATAALDALGPPPVDDTATQPVRPVPPPRRRSRRRAARIGLVAALLAVITTAAIVWQVGDTPSQVKASGNTAGIPAPHSTSTKPNRPTSTTTTTTTTVTSQPPASPSVVAATRSMPRTTNTTPPPVAPLAQPLVTFSTLTGEDCPQDSTKGVSDSGGSTWGKYDGGWTGDGCTGQYVAAKVHNATYTWWFNTGSVPNGMCDVDVYVPPSGSPTLGGTASYGVYNGQPDTWDATHVADFTLSQTHEGWQDAGSYATQNGYLDIRLTNKGSGSTYVAAAAIRITCQP
jgi:serine/threonine protein kinase